jgi:hypothetical protein
MAKEVGWNLKSVSGMHYVNRVTGTNQMSYLF